MVKLYAKFYTAHPVVLLVFPPRTVLNHSREEEVKEVVVKEVVKEVVMKEVVKEQETEPAFPERSS